MLDGSWPGWSLMQSGISAASGLLGVFVGAWMTYRSQKKERRAAHLRQQLQEFYSPMLGMRANIGAKSATREMISSVARRTWSEQQIDIADAESRSKIAQAGIPMVKKLQEYNYVQLREELIPIYQRMMTHFTEQMWLAEESTQAYYPKLVEYVEIWNRHLKDTLEPELVMNLNHSEAELKPFYEDLLNQFGRLKRELNE
jgi:hypothetical protein